MATFTKLYLTNRAEPYTPATIRGAWDQTAGSVTRALDSSKLGGGLNVPITVTETSATADFDALIYRGISGPLAAQTFGGTVDLVLARVELDAAANMCWHVHIYITQGNSDTPRGDLLTDYTEVVANEWPTTTTAGGFTSTQTLAALAITAGDRMVVEIGYVARNSVSTSYGGAIRYGCSDAVGAGLTDLVAGDVTPNITTRAAHLVFSAAVTEGVIGIRESQAAVEVLANDTPSLRHSQTAIEILWASIPSLRHSQTVVEVLYRLPPSGGGGGGGGTNPTNGNLPTSLPLIFIYLRLVDGTIYTWSEVWGRLNDPSTWFGGEKQPRIRALGDVKTEFASGGSVSSYSWRATLDDNDGVLRAIARTKTFRGAYLACYVVDDAVRRALGSPYRFAAGVVTSHTLKEPMQMELVAEGALGRKLGRYNQEPKIPNLVLTNAEFPGLDPRREGRSPHVALGLVSDASSTIPEGVVPWQYTGTNNLQTFCGAGAVSVQVDAYLLSMGAMGWIYDSYYTVPVWGNEEVAVVGDLIRPADETAFYYTCTVAGTTGTSEPTWPTGVASTVTDGTVTWTRGEALNPLVRYLIPAASYGTAIAMPFKPGWTAATGLATNYVDYGTPTRRYTPAFVLNTHRYARALREGRIQIASNGIGLTDVADGTGLYFSDPVLQAQWVLINEGFASIDYTTYATIPTFIAPEGTYSILDTTSVATAKAVGDGWLAGGVIGGMLLGRDGRQQRLFEYLKEVTEGGLFKIGENRHGQIIFHRHNTAATPVVSFYAYEIIDGSVSCWLDGENYANHIRQYSAYRYEKLQQAASTPVSDWVNPVANVENSTAQAAVDETVTKDISNYSVRDAASIAAMNAELLPQVVGPAATMNGCPMMAFSLRWVGLGKNGVSVDLGTCISVTHPEARRTTAQTMIVEGRIVNGLRGTVTLICRVIEL